MKGLYKGMDAKQFVEAARAHKELTREEADEYVAAWKTSWPEIASYFEEVRDKTALPHNQDTSVTGTRKIPLSERLPPRPAEDKPLLSARIVTTIDYAKNTEVSKQEIIVSDEGIKLALLEMLMQEGYAIDGCANIRIDQLADFTFQAVASRAIPPTEPGDPVNREAP